MRRISWLGHATVLIEAGGARLLTDPVLRSRVAHLRRHAPPPAPPAQLDAVLVSHAHHDHLDLPSLKRLGAPPLALVPRGTADVLSGVPFGAVQELAAGETAQVGVDATRAIDVEAVPAWHPTRRFPSRVDHDALGYLVGRIWFAGDTDIAPEMEALRGRVDVALMPIWGWGPSLGSGHLDPTSAARAVALVAPAVVVPIHWGTFLPIGLHRRHGAVLQEPARAFADQVARVAPSVRVATLAPGESLDVDADSA